MAFETAAYDKSTVTGAECWIPPKNKWPEIGEQEVTEETERVSLEQAVRLSRGRKPTENPIQRDQPPVRETHVIGCRPYRGYAH
mgnify:CR=1 FL=1